MYQNILLLFGLLTVVMLPAFVIVYFNTQKGKNFYKSFYGALLYILILSICILSFSPRFFEILFN